MKKVLIITYYWPPAGGPGVQRVLKFAKYLPEFGWQPIILTIKDGEYPAIDKSLHKEAPVNCRVFKTNALEPNFFYKKFVGIKRNDIIRDAVLTEKNVNWKNKISNWLRLNFFIPDAKIGWKPFAVREGKKIIRKEKPDLIFSSSPPPTVHLIAKSLAKYSRLKWIADFRDPWTNVYFYHQLPKSRLTKSIDKRLEKRVLDTADRLTVVNYGFFDEVDRSKTVQIPNGFDSQDLNGITKISGNDKFTIRYMGSLKTRQYVDSFFSLLKDLSEDKNYRSIIKIEIIGNVNPDVKNAIQNKNIQFELNFIDYQSHENVLFMIQNAGLLLLVIGRSDISHKLLSGKVFEYLMVKRPILAYGPKGGAADELLKSTKAGQMFDYDDYEGAKKFLLNYYTNWQNGVIFTDFTSKEINRYERRELTRTLVNLFEEVS